MPWLMKSEGVLVALEGTSFMPAGPEIKLEARGVSDNADREHYSIIDWYAARAYLYKRNLSQDAQRRIAGMVSVQPDAFAQQYFSWPFDSIVDDAGAIVGYLANHVANTESLKVLLSRGDELSSDERIRIAKNLCIAFAIFQQHGFVFGSFTLSSVLVHRRTCRVFLNAGDRSQFEDGAGSLFLCPVAVPEYLPPEIHRYLQKARSLPQGARRIGRGSDVSGRYVLSENSDLFSLGVIIFALLHNGRHPLSCYISGEAGIPSLARIGTSGQSHPRVNSLMMGEWPETSFTLRTFGIPNYRLPWFRLNRAGSVYDRCYEFAANGNPRPSPQEWFSLLERKSRGIKARAIRAVGRLFGKMRSLFRRYGATATGYRAKQTITSQYPADLVGSEPTTSPRVFWRTTGLFALSLGLCSGAGFYALQLEYASVMDVFGKANPLVFVCGSLAGMFAANLLAGRARGETGFRPLHYALSFVSSAVLSIVCGVAMGGIL